MFTGIVQKTGRIVDLQRTGGAGRLVLDIDPWVEPLQLGESIAVNGCCLTVAGLDGRKVRFDLLEETFKRTCLGDKQVGQRINLERAVRMGETIGGHMVTGHIDGTGKVREVRTVGSDRAYYIESPRPLLVQMVPKGSISLDGISLTIVELGMDYFSVHIIPHTTAVTAIGELQPGHLVNLETDMIGKYVQRFLLASATASPTGTWSADKG